MAEPPCQAWASMSSPAGRSSVDGGSTREDIFFSPAAGRPSNDVILHNPRLNDAGNGDRDPYASCSSGPTRNSLSQPLVPSMNDAEQTGDSLQVDEADEDAESTADNAGREGEEDDEEFDVLYEDDIELAQLKRDFFFSQFVETPLQRFALNERRRLAALHDVLGRAISHDFGRQCVGDILELPLRSTEPTGAYREDLPHRRNLLLRPEEGDKKLPYSAYSGLMDLFLALAGSGDEADEPGNEEGEDDHVEEDGPEGDEAPPIEPSVSWHHLPSFEHSHSESAQAPSESHQGTLEQPTLAESAVKIQSDHTNDHTSPACSTAREHPVLRPSAPQTCAMDFNEAADGGVFTVLTNTASPEVAPHYYLHPTTQHPALTAPTQEQSSGSLLRAQASSVEKTGVALDVLDGVPSATAYTDDAPQMTSQPASPVQNASETAISQHDGNDSCCSPPLPAARESVLMTASLSAPCTPLITTATRLNTLGLSSACSKRTPI